MAGASGALVKTDVIMNSANYQNIAGVSLIKACVQLNVCIRTASMHKDVAIYHVVHAKLYTMDFVKSHILMAHA